MLLKINGKRRLKVPRGKHLILMGHSLLDYVCSTNLLLPQQTSLSEQRLDINIDWTFCTNISRSLRLINTPDGYCGCNYNANLNDMKILPGLEVVLADF